MLNINLNISNNSNKYFKCFFLHKTLYVYQQVAYYFLWFFVLDIVKLLQPVLLKGTNTWKMITGWFFQLNVKVSIFTLNKFRTIKLCIYLYGIHFSKF